MAVTIYLSGHVGEVVTFLEDNGGDPRNVGEDFIEAYVPVPSAGIDISAARRPPGAGNSASAAYPDFPANCRERSCVAWLPSLEPGRVQRSGHQGRGWLTFLSGM